MRLYRPQAAPAAEGEEECGQAGTAAGDRGAEAEDAPASAAAAAAAAAASDALADVAPLLDRLLLFFSDLRTPHEVLPACAPRRACTLWYVERDGASVRSK